MKEKLLLLCIILYAIRKTNSGGRPGTRLTYTYHLLHLCIIVHVLTCMSWNTETINLSFVAMPISPTVSVKTKGHKLMNKDQNFQVYNIVFATPLGRRFISIQEKCQTWVDYISQLGLKCSLHEASWRTSMGSNVIVMIKNVSLVSSWSQPIIGYLWFGCFNEASQGTAAGRIL